jgi:hypothetical protein
LVTRRIGVDSPAAHTPATLDWLRGHDVDPRNCFAIDLDDSTFTVHEFVRDEASAFVKTPDGGDVERTERVLTIEHPVPIALRRWAS